MKKMRKQLIKLLNIHGTSGNEKPVRNYLKPILENLMDTVEVDHYGNLLATKTIGNGKGATVLLSAHMDTVKGVLVDRNLIESKGIITSDKGALGADDRAGIAIILEVIRNIELLSFEGVLKVAFSREEEIGCIGANKIDKKFYADVDLAIVVDRRGNRDIVVGCGQAFCSDNVGIFFEEVSKMQNMDWKAVEGGISDACTFSENGINAVNLSAGYMNEHTDKEFVVLEDMKDTARLILQAFGVINQFYNTFGEVPENNKWVKAWYSKNYSSNKYYDNSYKYYGDYYTDYNYGYDMNDTIFAQECDERNGDVMIYEIGGEVVMTQGNNEIILTRENLKSLFGQIKHTL